MARVLLVRPGAGAPDMVPLEVWHALTRVPAFAAPGEPLAGRLRDEGYDVGELPEASAPAAASPREPAASAETASPGGLRGRNLLAPHAHGETPPWASTLATRLSVLAAEHGEVAFVVHDEAVIRAVFERALETGDEVEVVVGRAPRGHRLLDLVGVMARLRGPGGCPWDAEQTHQSLAKHLLDETYELLEAIESGAEAEIAEELGDLLLQVVFHAQMGTDAGAFDVDDVAHELIEKLVRRHPHVFGDAEVGGASDVVANWDEIKRHEKQRSSAIEGVPDTLPALAYAQKLQRRASAAGFGRPPAAEAGESEPGESEPGETVEDEASLGELLFGVVALARRLDLDAETALRRAAKAFRDRLVAVEELTRERGLDPRALAPEEMERLWGEASAR
ncbi:MAG TPA: nucleoside triphosphate pyrophosphohydrolase [Actinomycetota bacterium]